MIRIWKGPEMEGIGNKAGVQTLFICSDSALYFDDICVFIIQNPDIKALYFGAGRKDFAGMDPKSWHKLISLCVEKSITITIEVSPMMVDLFVRLYNHSIVTFVIAYYNAPKDMSNLYFKTDDYAVTKIYTPEVVVDITSVCEDRYPEDVVLYEDEER